MKNNKRILTCVFLLLLAAGGRCGEITVHNGESIADALRQAREWRRTGDARCQGGITIRIEPGRYYMAEPLLLRPEDSGSESSPLTIVGEDGAVVCGDPVQKHTQLWPLEGMMVLKAFDAAGRTITIPTPPKNVLQTKNLEMVVHQRWAIAILRVKAMAVNGDQTVVTFLEPESRLEFEHPWPQPVIADGQTADKSSSFLLRTTERRDGVERLLTISGTDGSPVHHVTISGITFEDACWNRPQHLGHVTLQGGFPLVDAYKLQQEGLPWDSGLENQAWIERPASAVSVSNAHHVSIVDCTFRNLGCTALDFASDIHDCQIVRNSFSCIGGTAILAGSFAESPMEVHRPYRHLASRCSRLTISENIIDRAATEDWGAVGIGCGYVSHVDISGNTVSNVNYSGICVGWGWTPADTGMHGNKIRGNCVSGYACQLYDAGGIYTLSNQPGSEITGNTVSAPTAAPYATNNRAFCIYLDARTDGFTIADNHTDGRPLTKDDIGFNRPGPEVIIK